MIRFVHFFRYADGMSAEEGEEWYLDKHVPRVRDLPGIKKYISWEAQPGRPGMDPESFARYVRRSDIYFDTLGDALAATQGNPQLWGSPSAGEPGFSEFECMYIEDEPQFDLLKDVPIQQYKYMGLPLKFSAADPVWLADDDVTWWVYFFNYRSNISLPDQEEWIVDGEDWYLGHHCREGSIMKQAGRRHYQTWLASRVNPTPASPFFTNRWYRITELGVPEGGNYWGNTEETQVELTQAEGGKGYGEFRNLILDPRLVQDLLE